MERTCRLFVFSDKEKNILIQIQQKPIVKTLISPKTAHRGKRKVPYMTDILLFLTLLLGSITVGGNPGAVPNAPSGGNPVPQPPVSVDTNLNQ